MNIRWFWWSFLTACLAMALIYLVVLAFNHLGAPRPSARAKLVYLAPLVHDEARIDLTHEPLVFSCDLSP